MTVHAPIQADFRYPGPVEDGAGCALSVSIYADRGHLRETMREDALAIGLNVREAQGFAVLREGAARPLGDVVLLDCPEIDGAALAALARLDMRAANCGARLIVSTSIDALDDVSRRGGIQSPALLIVGEVAALAARLHWFGSPPRRWDALRSAA